jgi:hypothetical protein
VRHGVEQDVARDHQDGNPFTTHRRLHGDPQDARQLRGRAHQLAVDAALPEEFLWVRLLEVPAADLAARNLGGDRQDGYPAAVGVEQPVEQVRVPGTAARGADRQLAGDGRIRRCGEGRSLLVSHVQPLDVAVAAQRIGEPVQRVAGQSVDAADTARLQSGDDHSGNRGHRSVRRSVTTLPPTTRRGVLRTDET